MDQGTRRHGVADICVVGASAGGVEALRRFVAALPAWHAGTVLVVLHVPPFGSVLPAIVQRYTQLRCRVARDGEVLGSGAVHVAAPDRHLIVDRDRLRLGAAASEHGYRPAIDPLFRSAAYAYGPRVVGVILSGNPADGAAGLAAVKRRGGMALVEDPEDALFPGMPEKVLESVAVDATAAPERLAQLVAEVAGTRLEPGPKAPERRWARNPSVSGAGVHVPRTRGAARRPSSSAPDRPCSGEAGREVRVIRQAMEGAPPVGRPPENFHPMAS